MYMYIVPHTYTFLYVHTHSYTALKVGRLWKLNNVHAYIATCNHVSYIFYLINNNQIIIITLLVIEK